MKIKGIGKNWHERHIIAVILLTIVSIGLIVGGFFVPPLGMIDGSVLTAVGEIFAFAVLFVVMIAISRGADVEIQHGNTNIKIDNPDA